VRTRRIPYCVPRTVCETCFVTKTTCCPRTIQVKKTRCVPHTVCRQVPCDPCVTCDPCCPTTCAAPVTCAAPETGACK